MNEKKKDAAAENEYILHFAKPYHFEDETFTEVDLSEIENIKAQDMISVQKIINRSGDVSALPEMSIQYACYIASRITDKPVEFFTGLPAREAIKLKNIVTGFIFGAD